MIALSSLFTVGIVCDQEPEEFNQFLTKTYERLKKGDVANFFQLLSSKNISLISKGEAPDRLQAFFSSASIAVNMVFVSQHFPLILSVCVQ